MAQKDCYEILGIRPTASQQEIELAYKARRTQYHPDKYATSDEATVQWATAQIQEVNRAYEVLSDEQRRQEYDEAYSPSGEEASQQTGGNASGQNSARLVEGIIPLSMTHDDLEKQIYRYMASGNYTPDDMLETATITLKESFYVPAYVFQVEYSATWTASFGYDRTEAHKAYRIVTGPRGGKRREAYTEYSTVTDWRLANGVDEGVFFVSTYAGNRLNNLALEPAGLVPGIVSEGGVEAFNPSHAKGIEVEPSSVPPTDAFQTLQPKINTTIDNNVKKHSQGNHQKDWRWNATMNHEMVTLVVPLCHATFAYGGKNYDFWVSGHNGKEIRATSLPVDQGRKNLVYAGFAPLAAGLVGVGLVTSMGGFMWVTLVTSALAAAYGIMRRQSIIDYSKKHREALLDQLHAASARNGIGAEEKAQLANTLNPLEKPTLAKSGNDKVVLPILAIASLLGAVIPGYMGNLTHSQNQLAPMQQSGYTYAGEVPLTEAGKRANGTGYTYTPPVRTLTPPNHAPQDASQYTYEAPPPPPSKLGSGYKQLFQSAPGKISLQDQQTIYSSLQLKQSEDGKSFILDGCDPANFEVQIQDINGDGIAEVFVLGGNNCTSGHAENSIWLFIKAKQGDYQTNFGFPAATYKILSEKNDGFPDIQFGGPGFCEPVWRWSGQSYIHYKDIPTSNGGCNPTR